MIVIAWLLISWSRSKLLEYWNRYRDLSKIAWLSISWSQTKLLVYFFVENLICTSLEEYSSSLSARPHLYSRKFKRMDLVLALVRYDVSLALMLSRCAIAFDRNFLEYWCCTIVQSKISWVSTAVKKRLLEYWSRDRDRLIENYLSIGAVRLIVRSKIAWVTKIAWASIAIDRSLENWRTLCIFHLYRSTIDSIISLLLATVEYWCSIACCFAILALVLEIDTKLIDCVFATLNARICVSWCTLKKSSEK